MKSSYQNSFRKTKIIATLGPSSFNKIEDLIKLGVNVFRLNFSHGSHIQHGDVIKSISKIRKKLKIPVAIMADLQGPKIRVGKVKSIKNKEGNEVDIPLILVKGEEFIITTDKLIGSGSLIFTSYKTLPQEVKFGDRIYFDDGNLCVEVVSVKKNQIYTTVIIGGKLFSNKGMNLPDTDLNSPALTKKDVTDLNFLLSLENSVDAIALSFVRNFQDIIDAQKIILASSKSLPIIAKIERPEGIINIDKIIDVADGIMVARGDLGVEVDSESVPHHQKNIISKCNLLGKPVIVATQMLDSVINNPRSTRAEATDCANAVLDGASALMLSGETANGGFPLKAVEIMDKIINYTEKNSYSYFPKINFKISNDVESITNAAVKLANSSDEAKFIFCVTRSGKTAKETARYRPNIPIIALTKKLTSEIRFLLFFWGVYIEILEELGDSKVRIVDIENKVNDFYFLSKNDLIIFTGGLPLLSNNITNMIKVHRIS